MIKSPKLTTWSLTSYRIKIPCRIYSDYKITVFCFASVLVLNFFPSFNPQYSLNFNTPAPNCKSQGAVDRDVARKCTVARTYNSSYNNKAINQTTLIPRNIGTLEGVLIDCISQAPSCGCLCRAGTVCDRVLARRRRRSQNWEFHGPPCSFLAGFLGELRRQTRKGVHVSAPNRESYRPSIRSLSREGASRMPREDLLPRNEIILGY